MPQTIGVYVNLKIAKLFSIDWIFSFWAVNIRLDFALLVGRNNVTNRKTHWVITIIGTVVLLRVTIITFDCDGRRKLTRQQQSTTKKETQSKRHGGMHLSSQNVQANLISPWATNSNIIWFICYSFHAVFVCALYSSIERLEFACDSSNNDELKGRKKLDPIIIRPNPKSQLYKTETIVIVAQSEACAADLRCLLWFHAE